MQLRPPLVTLTGPDGWTQRVHTVQDAFELAVQAIEFDLFTPESVLVDVDRPSDGPLPIATTQVVVAGAQRLQEAAASVAGCGDLRDEILGVRARNAAHLYLPADLAADLTNPALVGALVVLEEVR